MKASSSIPDCQLARRKGSKRVSVGIPREEARVQRWLTRALIREPLRPGYKRVVCSELDVSSGIADVVSATLNGTGNPAKWLSPTMLRLLNLTTTKLLAQLRCRRYQSIESVAAGAGVSFRTALQHLRMLEKIGFAKFRKDSVMLLVSTRERFRQVDAFEVKVADWRHALYQATHYRSFANRVNVALPDKKAKAVLANRKAFQTFGVGLVGISPPDSLKWYIKPVNRRPASESKSLFGLVQILRTPQARVLRKS